MQQLINNYIGYEDQKRIFQLIEHFIDNSRANVKIKESYQRWILS